MMFSAVLFAGPVFLGPVRLRHASKLHSLVMIQDEKYVLIKESRV